jgi:Skp family chaperone for outer membrane proteins
MKTLQVSLLVSALVFVSPSIFSDAPAVKTTDVHAAKPGLTVVVVDGAQIIDPVDPVKSKATEWTESYKAFSDSFEKEGKALEKEALGLQKLQSEVEAAYKKLEEGQKAGKQPTKEETTKIQTMVQEFQMKNQELSKKGQQLNEKGQTQFMQLRNDFKAKIDAASKTVANKKGFGAVAVAPKEIFYYVSDGYDITADVVVELNSKHAAEKRAKKMTAEVPKTAAKAA